MNDDSVRFVGRDGKFKLPRRAMDLLGARPGGKVRMEIDGDRVVLLRYVSDDPFEEALTQPEDDAFDKLVDAQQSARARAKEKFDDLLANPPEAKPEDDPNLWD